MKNFLQIMKFTKNLTKTQSFMNKIHNFKHIKSIYF